MEYGRLGERQRGLQLPLLEIISSILLLIAIVLGMFELVKYSNAKDDLPTDLTVAGIPVGGLSERDARARWEAVYMEQPLQLFYADSLIELDPAAVGFRTNSEAMLADARAQSSRENSFWAGFWNYLERRPVAAVTVPLDAEFSESDLRLFLEELAARYDSQAGEAGYSPTTLTFQTGAMGRKLDIDQAMILIEQALFDPNPANRRIVLPIQDASAQLGNMETLRQAILDLMASRGFDNGVEQTVTSVYIMDLQTGEEVSILSDVPHSAFSTIKVPIMVNLFRQKLLIDPESAYLLTESVLCSNNSASNLLMQVAGATPDVLDPEAQLRAGLNQVSCTAQDLGAEHTYISAPLFVADRAYEFEAVVCRPERPANTAHFSNPDAYSQTTAEDMGLLLTEIYDCANYGSGLQALYPDDITQSECQQMIEVMSGNRIDRLIELGVPLGTRVAHKNGWGPGVAPAYAGPDTGDAAIVFSPGGDYVIVLYVYEPDVNNNGLPTLAAWELIEEVSRLTYNFFNPDSPLLTRREPISPFGAIDCVTVSSPDLVNLNDIDQNRLDENGNPLPAACYGGAGDCKPFDDWGRQLAGE